MQRYHLDMEGIPEYITTRLSIPKSNPIGQAILSRLPPSSSLQPVLFSLLSVSPAPTKAGRVSTGTRRVGKPGKLCTSQMTIRPWSRSKPLVAKTNLGQQMARSISLLLPPSKPMVHPSRLMTSINISMPSLRMPPLRRGYWRTWSSPILPSLPPTLNCVPLCLT